MLALLSDYGLAKEICRLFEVSNEDFEALALLEMESRKLAQKEVQTDG